MPRPAGRKNNKTLLKEMELQKTLKLSGGYLITELPAVLKAVVEKAKGGDMQAAKLILDRTISTRKSIEHISNSQDIKISISVADPKGVTYEAEAAISESEASTETGVNGSEVHSGKQLQGPGQPGQQTEIPDR